ncbi:nuclear transport factor 2 family protein [Superficieibacter sp. HKU1]|uniref:nuclear transport factor 2 family protein n=1 Tax=Superficieibacter sp. HKU1 TaxID=3031919 RepID=UPI0023E34B5D|nr:nuclear transport factor 2 family protein [Superficieibacter sp. HKU1]WES70487.1 nuclear transport factor 2 family protein [Superficieibacter sp. HKU1]
MRKLFYMALLLLSSTCMAQSTDIKAVTDAVENMRLAMLSGEKSSLEKVGLPSLSYGHSSGRVENNAEFVNAIVTGKSRFQTLNLSDQTVQVDGDVAIVRHILEAKTNDSGKPGDVKIGVMLVMKKDNAGEWKLLARQAYKLPL